VPLSDKFPTQATDPDSHGLFFCRNAGSLRRLWWRLHLPGPPPGSRFREEALRRPPGERWYREHFEKRRAHMLSAWEAWVAREPDGESAERQLQVTWQLMLQSSGLEEVVLP